MCIRDRQWHPGWQAQINGKQTKLYIAEGCLQAVWIPSAGEYLLKLRFFPQSFRLGLLVCLLLAIGLPIVLWRICKRKETEHF
ncbi:MAG: YfhO family protein, partial [Candidatus Sumerlaeia bacterium]|nr:YfhO family protein [Candidatus Sumerlaeia bacterium]